MKMTKIETAKIIIKQKGWCKGVECRDCFRTEGSEDCDDTQEETMKRAEAYLKRYDQPKINEYKEKENYNNRVWLNPDNVCSTGSIVCFSGQANWSERGQEFPCHSRFVEISDCNHKVRIHQSKFDTKEEFIAKIKTMKQALDEYIDVLMSEEQ